MRRLTLGTAIGTLAITIGGSSVAALPNAGEGGKFVADLSETRTIDCDDDGTDDLDFAATGWVQLHLPDGERIDTVAVFHVDNLFTNADGDRLEFKDRGPDVVSITDDGAVVAVTGRSQVGNVGRLVIDLSTFEVVFRAGTAPFGGDAFDPDLVGYACDRLS